MIFIPKRTIHSLTDLTPSEDSTILIHTDLVTGVVTVVEKFETSRDQMISVNCSEVFILDSNYKRIRSGYGLKSSVLYNTDLQPYK